MTKQKHQFVFPAVTPTLHIGVTGHRLNQIPEQKKGALSALVKNVMRCAKDEAALLYGDSSPAGIVRSNERPRLRLISSLAEGVDRMAAEAALDAGYELFTILPQKREIYEQSFEMRQDLPIFEELLSKSTGVMEIACGNDETSFAYADVAHVMLRHSDILLTVWNGKKTKYVAGTYATVKEAIKENIPILYIPLDAESVQDIRCFMNGEMHRDWQRCLRELLGYIVTPPRSAEVMMPELYSGQSTLVGHSSSSPEKDFENFVLSPFHTLLSKLPFCRGKKQGCHSSHQDASPVQKQGTAAWGHSKQLFSKLTGYYSERYRTSLLLRNIVPLFALVSLLLALSGKHLGVQSLLDPLGLSCSLFFLFQIFLLFFVIYLVRKDKKTREHSLSYGYRVLAEKCRLNIYLWPMGFCNVRYRHRSYQSGEKRDPVSWYYRALVREKGLPSGTIDHQTLRDWLAWIDKELFSSQMKYHTKRKKNSYALAARMRFYGQLCFILGIAATIARAITSSFSSPVFWAAVVSCLALFLPALASFWASYSNNIGLPTNFSASSAMEEVFNSLRRDVSYLLQDDGNEKLFKNSLSFSDALALCERVNSVCMDDLSDWEHSIQSKNIKYV